MRSPFHHQILPWIFAIIFLAFAPLVVFYTSGYRWNAKKGRVERNGTLIIDSTPSGAFISIDGRRIESTTPITLQDLPPGLHRFSVEKPGYRLWEKTLDARPERVTFASGIWLWKTAEPRLVSSEPVLRLSQSGDERHLIEFVNGTTTRVIISDALNHTTRPVDFSTRLAPPVQLTWSSDRFVLIESPTRTPLLLDARRAEPPIELPEAQYRWEETDLVGRASGTRYLLRPPSQKLTKEPVAASLWDQLDSTVVQPRDETFILTSTRTPHRGYVLPRGQWLLWNQNTHRVLLRNHDHWMSFVESDRTAETHEVRGDRLRPSPARTREEYLLVHQGELWRWNPKEEPELLYRQSDPILAASWHHEGSDVFVATSQEVFVLNLDPRDGRRRTTLARFDKIFDFLALKDRLRIAATQKGVRGVWELEVE